ncbi:MAG TPA: glycosyltransferase family 39 protein [Candidatus Udaeobacter sp.]|jgi:hypothetical protein|nr:glycosyltransferase family 39 protein [Candidatus Udaeobacter sp.]
MHERERSARPWLVGALTLAVAFWLLDLAALRAGVPDPLDDTWEYGVAARHLIEGDGFRTRVIHPPLVGLMDDRATVPLLIHGPLMPILISPILAGTESVDSASVLSAVFAVLAAWLIFRIGERRFGAAIGAAAAGLFTIAPLTLRAVHHDPSLMVGAALLLAAIDRLDGDRPMPFISGVAIGLALLARAEMLAAAIVLLVFAGRRGAIAFAVGMLIVAAPWWLHNARATGQPFFNLSSYLLIGYTPAHPGLSVLRDFNLPPAAFPAALRSALPGLPAKWAEAFPHALKRMLLAPTGGSGWLTLIGAGLALRSERRSFAVLMIALAMIPLAIMTLTVYDPRYITPFLPIWALGAARGAEALSHFLPAWGRRPRAWAGALLLIVLPSVAPALREASREARSFERVIGVERRSLRGFEHWPNRLILSDTPDFVAFTTGRPVVWMTEAELVAARRDGRLPPGLRASDRWFHDTVHE